MFKEAGPPVVVISFAAFHGDPYPREPDTGRYRHPPERYEDPRHWGPTLRTLGLRASPFYGRVSHWYYLCHTVKKPRRETGASDLEVGEDTKTAIEERLPPAIRPHFEIVPWKTTLAPNDHAALWEFVREQLRRVRSRHPGVELVLVLSSGTAPMHAVLFLAGSVGVVDGPVRLVQTERGAGAEAHPDAPVVDVTLKVETVLQIARGTTPARPASDEAPTLAYEQARSPALVRAREEARHAARLPFPVLLRGERGVGKSSLAVLIRAWSPYRQKEKDRQWAAIACGQFTDPQLLMAELCGSVKGAFTNVETRSGLLTLADKDTLFLDEIHDMSEPNQRVIIRLLEDKQYRPVGSTKLETSDFRLITGTNQPDSVLATLLSADFLDRIRDIEIHVPPLRECPEDLPWMWTAAWEAVARDAELPLSAVDPHRAIIVEALARDPLPGNWRDLRRLAARLAMRLVADGTLSERTVKGVLAEVFSASAALAPAEPGARLLPKRQAEQLHKLEGELGPDLAHLWAACADGTSPHVALLHLLGDRHRAARAEKFIPKVFPERWAGLAARTRPTR